VLATRTNVDIGFSAGHSETLTLSCASTTAESIRSNQLNLVGPFFLQEDGLKRLQPSHPEGSMKVGPTREGQGAFITGCPAFSPPRLSSACI
jgi:hypothetical protein